MEKSRRSKFYSVSDTTTSEFRRGWYLGEPDIIQIQYTASIDTSLSTTRVRQRLCDLMGTDVIRLNDKRYFQELSERLQDEYETNMDKQEDARCAAEDQRIRKLMLDGVIKAPNDYRAVVQGDRPKKSAKKKKKRRSKKRTPEATSTYMSDEHSTGMSRHSDDDRMDRDLVTQVAIMSGSRPSSSGHKPKQQTSETRHVPSSSNTVSTSSSKTNTFDLGRSKHELHVRPPHHDNSRVSSSHSNYHRKSRRVKSASSRLVHWDPAQQDEDSETDDKFDAVSLPGYTRDRPQSKFSKHEPESIKILRQEETVAGLYSLAEELISPVKTEDLVDSRKVNTDRAPPKPKKKMTVQF